MGDLFNLSLGNSKTSGGGGKKTGGVYSAKLRELGKTGKGSTSKGMALAVDGSFATDKQVRIDWRAGQSESFEKGDLVFSLSAAKNVDRAGNEIPAKRGSLEYFIVPADLAARIPEAQFIQIATSAVDIAWLGRARGKRLGELNVKSGEMLDSFKEAVAEAEAVKAEAEQAVKPKAGK